MKTDLLIQGLGLVIYLGFFIGLGLLFWDLIKSLFQKDNYGPLYVYQGLEISLEKYLLWIGLLIVAGFAYTYRLMKLGPALVVSLGLVFMIQMFLFIRASNLQRKGSYEGENLVADFLREYRINNFNVFTALERMVASDSDLKVNKRHMKILLYEIRATGNPEVIKAKTDDFAKSVGTNWGRMLAYNIYTGASTGSDVSPGLEDTLIQLRDAKSSAEERKRLNSETARMVYVMIPALYVATLFMAANFLDITIGGFLKNQFATGEGLMFFYFIVFLFIVNLALLNLIMTQKLDY